MAASKKPRIVVVKQDHSATQVAEKEVKPFVKGANIMDAVDVMAGDHEHDEKDVLCNGEFNCVLVDLTDKDAENLEKNPGIEAVEEDEEMFAIGEGPAPTFADEGDLDAVFSVEDEEAAEEIAASNQLYDSLNHMQDEEAKAAAETELQRAPCASNEIDFDEVGNLIQLDQDNTQLISAGQAAGIPKDKIIELVKCIIRCALKQSQSSEVSEEYVEKLLAEQGLESSNESVQAIRDYITCGLRIIYARYAWPYSTGAGVRVAVVDTGIAPRHPDLRVYGGASFVPGVRSWADDQGHGTHVAGTIAAAANNRGLVGVAPNARLYAVKVLDRNGRGFTSWILNGLAWCYRTRMHVANLSLGGAASTHDRRVYSRAYEQAGRMLRRRGILACAAAGNSGRTANPYVGNPARCPSFMAVSAVDCNRRRAAFSSFGPQVEITAPGVSVWSTYPPTGYRQLSGTSMACPHVAGTAALVKRRNPGWSGDRIRVHLWKTAGDLGVPGHDWLYGHGLVNAYRAVR